MNIFTQEYKPVDIILKGQCSCENPFYIDVKAVFKGPNNERIAVPGFYDGDSTWKIRFSPKACGLWQYVTYSSEKCLNNMTGSIECTPNTNENIHGGLLVDQSNNHHFIHEDGSHHFMLVYEADWLWALGLNDPEIKKIRELIQSIKPYGFNGVMVNFYAHDTSWCSGHTSNKDYGPPDMYIWEGTNECPDHNHMNLDFFANYDRMMTYLMEQGIVAHIFLKVYNKGVNWPERYSIQEDLYFKYIVSRYQAFPNVIWDFSKESYNEPDKDYIKNRIDFIKTVDGYHRLVTTHDDRVFYSSYRTNHTADFFTTQQHSDFYSDAIIERQKNKWPVFNSEFCYECGAGGLDDKTYNVTQTAQEVINRTYEVVMAGAYPAYYYTFTAWDVIDYDYLPKGYEYIKILHDFFTSIKWWQMEPHSDFTSGNIRCLAIPGKEYVFYFHPGQRGRLTIEKSDNIEMVWTNTLTGEVLKEYKQMQRGCSSPFLDAPSLLHIVL